MNRRDLSHFSGCLLGGAIGDALGAAVEFIYSLGEIRERFGAAGVTDYAPVYGHRGAITDDTQMTLFTAEGLIAAYDRGAERGIWDPPAMVHAAYLRWLAAQGGSSSHPLFDAEPGAGLALVPAMRSRRAPGHTCLSALTLAEAGTMDHPLNDSKGAGGIMRIAPVGLAFAEPFERAARIAALTHGHPSGYLAAGAFAVIVASLAAGQALPEAVAGAAEELARWPGHEESLRALQEAVEMAERGKPSAERVQRLGEGWVAEEALALGVYCALVAEDFRHGVLLAVNHKGDSDTTGSLTGQLLGLVGGEESLPGAWLEELEAAAEMRQMTAGLHERYANAL